jgi:hypothetical protein
MFDVSELMAGSPAQFFVYPVIVDDEGNEELGTRLSCFSFDDALYVARRLVPEIPGALAVTAHELASDVEGEDGEIAFADIAKFGEVSERVLQMLDIDPSVVTTGRLSKRRRIRI